MGVIRLVTEDLAPDRLVVLRWAPQWQLDRGGDYTDGAWTFEIDEAQFPAGIAFRFVLAPGRLGPVTRLTQAELAAGADFAGVAFAEPEGLTVETGSVAQRFFPRNTDPDHVYDVVVVGSGMGGGLLASRLARAGQDVLVLEAGSYLFPTHVGNLARQLRIGGFTKHVWSLWDEFKVRSYETDSPGVDAGHAFALGGRSLFWGGLVPRMAPWEFAGWPASVQAALENGGYAAAEQALNVVPPERDSFQEKAREAVEALAPGFVAEHAPVAVQYRGASALGVPAGYFSTADLLLEDRLLTVSADAVDRKPQVNLHHAVQRVEPGLVHSWDLLGDRPRTYRGQQTVLAAGTIESAKIALLSGLPHPLIGRGITDHTIRFRHFALPPGTLGIGPGESAKIVLRHPAAAHGAHGFLVVVEIGANLNQSRYVDPTNLVRERAVRAGWTECEVVVLFPAALAPGNAVTLQGDDPATRVRLAMDRVAPPPADLAEADRLVGDLLTGLGAQPILGEDGGLALQDALLGGVAHEVGTLRLGTDPATSVVDPNLAFHGVPNLYACDNSVLPTSPAANPSLTTAALALRLAAHLAP